MTAAITAGLLNAPVLENGQSLNSLANVQTVSGQLSTATFNPDTFGSNLLAITGRAMVSAGVNSAIYGGSFGDALKHNLLADLAAVSANAIGQTWGDGQNPGMQVVAHAGLGCVTAAAGGNDCASGAIGGAGAALLNPLFDGWIAGEDGLGWGSDLNRQAGLTGLSMLSTGLAAYATGNEALTAATAAQNETLNNWLSNKPGKLFPGASEQEEFAIAARQCANDQAAACARMQELVQVSALRDDGITVACATRGSPDCRVLIRRAIENGNDVYFGRDGRAYVYPKGTPTASNTERPSNKFEDAVAQGVMELAIGELLASGAVMIGRTVVGGGTTLLGLGAQGWNKIRPVFSEVDEGAKGGVAVAEDVIAVQAAKNTPSVPASNYTTISPLGSGASSGPVPLGYVTVSRWVSPEEAAQWVKNQGTAIPAGVETPVPGASATTLYVTAPGAAKPGGTGPIRIDFAVPEKALNTAGSSQWSQIYQPSQSTPVYNVRINVPNGMNVPGVTP